MPAEKIQKLIDEATAWRNEHKLANRGIEAAACKIRIRALQDALKAIEE